MKNSVKLLTSAPLWLTFACTQDDAGFIPLDTLCVSYVEAVCDGQENCCGGDVKRVDCERDTQAACEGAVAALVEESSLSYSGERAFDRLQAMRADLSVCQPGYGLGRFFEGGLSDGEACERASECVSLRCDASDRGSVCSVPTASLLCEPTDK